MSSPRLLKTLTDDLKNVTNNDLTDSTWKNKLEELCSLYHLYNGPVNRDCVESMHLLVKIFASLTLESTDKVKLCSLVVEMLQKYKYHGALLEEQINCGIVKALVDKMKALLGPVVPYLNADHQVIPTEDVGMSSGSESIESDSEMTMFAIENAITSEVVPDRRPSFLERSTTNLSINIIILIRILADYRPIIHHLVNEELLLALIKTSEHFTSDDFTRTRIEGILDLIMGNYELLLPIIMQTDCVMALQSLKRTKHKRCSVCGHYKSLGKKLLQNLRTQAESGFGLQAIADKLVRGEVSIRKRLVLAIPYIIREKSVLFRLMIKCGGLDILMELLKDDSQLQERGVRSLCVMITSPQLNIVNPKDISSICRANSVIRFSSDREKSTEASQVVRFKLDDGSVLKADRSVICKHSDYFSSMLNGSFKESNEEEITLQDVSNKTLKCLLHLMECDIKTTELNKFDVDLNTHLELIALCDKFLMPDLCNNLKDSIVKFRLSADNIPVIYQWSLQSGTNFLYKECIAFAFEGKIVQNERVKMFEKLLSQAYSDELMEDIQKLITEYYNLAISSSGFI